MRSLALIAVALAGFAVGATVNAPTASDCLPAPADINIRLVDMPGEIYYRAEVTIGDTTIYCTGPMRGDCNLSGDVTILDATWLVHYLWMGGR
jgi:hypothetical protein